MAGESTGIPPPRPPPTLQANNQYRCAFDLITPVGQRILFDKMVCVPFTLNENIGGRAFSLNDLELDCQGRVADFYTSWFDNAVPAAGSCHASNFVLRPATNPGIFLGAHESCNLECRRGIIGDESGLHTYTSACISPGGSNHVIGRTQEPCHDPAGQTVPLLDALLLQGTVVDVDLATSSLSVASGPQVVPVAIRHASLRLPEPCVVATCAADFEIQLWLAPVAFDGHQIEDAEVSAHAAGVLRADGRLIIPAGSVTARLRARVDGVQAQLETGLDSPLTGVLNFAASTFSLGGALVTDPSLGNPLRLQLELGGAIRSVPPKLSAGVNQIVECDAPGGAWVQLEGAVLNSSQAGPLLATWYELGADGTRTVLAGELRPKLFLPLGRHQLALEVLDTSSTLRTASVEVEVRDTTPPEIESVIAAPDCAWAPNHKWVGYSLGTDIRVAARDVCSPAQVNSRVLSVTADEAANAPGSGNTDPDVAWSSTGLCVRSERSGRGRARTYTVVVATLDGSGNTSVGTTQIRVPHSNQAGCRDETSRLRSCP